MSIPRSAGHYKKSRTVALLVELENREEREFGVSHPIDKIKLNHEIEPDFMFIDGAIVQYLVSVVTAHYSSRN